MASANWTEAHAKQLLDACVKSGLSVAEFARREGIRTKRLEYWRKRLRSTSKTSDVRGASSFAPAVVKQAPRVFLARGASVVIGTKSGATIEIVDASRVSPTWVGAMVRELSR